MNQIDALRHLHQQASPVVESRDVAAMLRVSASNATIDRFALPEPISAPYPACVSLRSALFHHGLIEQIPEVIYAVTMARPRRVHTPLGTVSYHRIPTELLLGFELQTRSDANSRLLERRTGVHSSRRESMFCGLRRVLCRICATARPPHRSLSF